MIGVLLEAKNIPSTVLDSIKSLYDYWGDTLHGRLLDIIINTDTSKLHYEKASSTSFTRNEQFSNRKLASIVDREGKMRVVAIFD